MYIGGCFHAVYSRITEILQCTLFIGFIMYMRAYSRIVNCKIMPQMMRADCYMHAWLYHMHTLIIESSCHTCIHVLHGVNSCIKVSIPTMQWRSIIPYLKHMHNSYIDCKGTEIDGSTGVLFPISWERATNTRRIAHTICIARPLVLQQRQYQQKEYTM